MSVSSETTVIRLCLSFRAHIVGHLSNDIVCFLVHRSDLYLIVSPPSLLMGQLPRQTPALAVTRVLRNDSTSSIRKLTTRNISYFLFSVTVSAIFFCKELAMQS